MEGSRSTHAAGGPSLSAGAVASGSQLQPPQTWPYGLPGFGGIPPALPCPSTVVHTSPVPHHVPITQIQFPHSPSAIPPFSTSPSLHLDHPDDRDDTLAVPRYHKLSFPTFDGKDDPLGWLNRCEHFFRAQRTRDSDKVWLASFHMNGVAQHWFYMLEREAGDIAAITWPIFRSLCQQRFGPPLGTNHLSELAHLPFRTSVSDYQENFQARMAHAGYLSPAQQVQLFTEGLPEPLRTDVELQAPADLQHAMSLARAFERHSSALTSANASRVPRPTS